MMSLEAKIEALLYAAGEEGIPLTELCELVEIDLDEMKTFLKQLEYVYTKDPTRGLTLLFVSNRVLLVAKKEMEPILRTYAHRPLQTSLSAAALEILSIIAYKQPLTRLEVDAIRGVHSGGSIQKLLLRGLIKEKGRLDTPGRPVIYETTDYFLNYFGLKKIQDLPPLAELEEPTLKESDLFSNSETIQL